jgi:hypothetical protein
MTSYLQRTFDWSYEGLPSDQIYRAHQFVANSDLKEVVARYNGKKKLENLEVIFEFGSLFDALVLEPHKANMDHGKLELALAMKKTLLNDKMIQKVFGMYDFRRQHEFYRRGVFGVEGAKCKCDGDSKALNFIFELKGLAVNNQSQFEEAINFLDYDQAMAWYMETAKREHYLIAASSKTKPDNQFQNSITCDHKFYKSGLEKVKHATWLWKMYGFK